MNRRQASLTDSAEAVQSRLAMLASSIEAPAAGAGSGSEQQARPLPGAIHTIARGVEPIEGRKTLILFSQGFHIPASLAGTGHSLTAAQPSKVLLP